MSAASLSRPERERALDNEKINADNWESAPGPD